MGKSNSNSHHDFDQCSLRHWTTVKALGSLESGFSLPLSLNSRMGEDSPALEPSSSPNPHLPMLGLGCWARGFFRKGTSVGSWTIFPCSPWLLLLFNSRLLISNSYISERSDRLSALEREIGTIHTSAGDPWASPWGKWWWHHPPSDIPVREWISLNLFFWDYIHTCSQSAHQVFQQWRLPLFYRESRGNSNCSSQPRTTTFGSLPELQLNDKLSYRFLCHFGLDYSSLCGLS